MAESKTILVLIGTRPEALKLFPVIQKLRLWEHVNVLIGVTGQHRELLDKVLQATDIRPDFDLNVMKENQSLDQLTARLLLAIGGLIEEVRPDRVVVQGDTATAMIGALSAYYHRTPVSHVEAGLRSNNIYEPWPEEVNRKIVTAIADQNFAPTEEAAQTLRNENVGAERIYVTGNTVIDALHMTKAAIDSGARSPRIAPEILSRAAGRRLILVTCHRRENFGARMTAIGDALETLLERDDVFVVLPVHPNPNVREVLGARLASHPRAKVIPAQDYLEFVGLLNAANFVLTDSGGVQEEAPALGKPVLVMRETTERPEGVAAGTALLVGSSADRIVLEANRLLDDSEHYLSMSRAHNPFGDGFASDRIARIIAG